MGFGEKTRAVEIRGPYMGTIANEMHACGQKGSAGKFIFETNPGRPGLLKIGGVPQSHEVGRYGGSEVVFDKDFLARGD